MASAIVAVEPEQLAHPGEQQQPAHPGLAAGEDHVGCRTVPEQPFARVNSSKIPADPQKVRPVRSMMSLGAGAAVAVVRISAHRGCGGDVQLPGDRDDRDRVDLLCHHGDRR